jgi:iron(III) transport system substrate-binding protein
MEQRRQSGADGAQLISVKKISMKSFLLACAALIAAPLAAAADNPAILAKAKEEAGQGTFQIMVSSPKGEKEQRAVMEAFQKRIGFKVDWEWIPLTSGVSGPRIAQQAKSNIRLPSAFGGYSYVGFENWIAKNELDAQVDWVGEFSGMFPDIKTAAQDTVLPKYRKRLLRQWDVHYVMVYNTKLVKKAEVPASLAELAEPKWRGRFGMSNTEPSPLQYLALEQGVEEVVALAKRLVANSPRYKAGPPAIVGAISGGEIAVGVSGYTALAEALKAKGAPVDWVVLDKLPLVPVFDFMLKGAPQPTLGKLFLAWLVTEGRGVQEEQEQLSLFANPASPTTRKIRAMNPKVKVVDILKDEDLNTVSRADKEIMQVVSGATK